MSEDLAVILKEAKGQRLVFVSGNFNVIHPGHLRILRFAKECGDCLVVGVNSDALAEGGAVISEALRLEGVRANSFVDHAFLLECSPAEAIHALQPNVVVKGTEHEQQSNPERAAVEAYGGRLLFCSGDTVFSSFDLLERETEWTGRLNDNAGQNYCDRHGIHIADLNELIQRFEQLTVCVVGDLIVDEYVTCEPVGMSQEDPTLVVSPLMEDRFLGGAAIVAAHVAGLGARVRFWSARGNDDAGRFAADALEGLRVDAWLVTDESRPTTVKRRYRADGKTMLRVNRLRSHAIDQETQARLIESLEPQIAQADLVIFSDFNYGCLPTPMVKTLIECARKHGAVVVADSQSSSQTGDVGRFQGVDLLTPTEREARLSLQDHESGLVVLAEQLRQKANAGNLLLTLNKEGVLLHAGDAQGEWKTDRLPAFNPHPADPAGAGDCLLAATSLALAAKGTIWQATYLGSVAAAIQVGRVGNQPVTAREITQANGGLR
jgi:rfaE bifunctional protein kinase chain/domain